MSDDLEVEVNDGVEVEVGVEMEVEIVKLTQLM
jgi:hypothetical protein